jgi:hypothetical protein
MLRTTLLTIFAITLVAADSVFAESVDLTNASVVIRSGDLPAAEKVASKILTEEVGRRTGLTWKVTTDWPAQAKVVIAISTVANPPAWQRKIDSTLASAPARSEGYAVSVIPAEKGQPLIVAVTGYDSRGAMFGVGKLLRNLDWKTGSVSVRSDFHATEVPDRPLRGHQIGYRDTANSWDAWTFEQFDQYFREMAIFGANAVENIPWQEDKLNPLMKYPREQMNVKFAELCEKYDLEHWIWVPVMIRLPNPASEDEFLKEQEAFYRKIKKLDAIFVPGGDPGDNKANVLIPYLEQMASLVTRYHPNVKIWLSLQYFKPDDVDFLYQYLETKQPAWFGGLVMGPSSPPMELTRRRLPKQYKLRWYPDITHVVRCQYPIPWLDPALGLTLGRECVNPRPVDYTQIYQMDYSFTDGFLSYSDGVHDDFNKNLWSQLGWNPNANPRDIATEYARFFFNPEMAEIGADGLFSLETDMRGSLADNGSITATNVLWKELERRIAKPGSPWRFQMHLFRAYYDAYTRARLLYETELERQALDTLEIPPEGDVNSAISNARVILERAAKKPVDAELLQRLNDMAKQLFGRIGLQTSVPTYHASGYERGAVMDFVNYPLNNRWWLEDQLDAIGKLSDSNEQRKRIDVLRNWENPGERGYYDVLGHVGRSPRIVKLFLAGDAMRHYSELPIPTQRWMGEKPNRLRQAWHNYVNSIPAGITYNDLDTSAVYVVKLFAQRTSPLMIDGVKAKLLKTGETYEQVTEQIFEVPADASKDGRITLTWEKLDERDLNWRQKHYVTDIWVMKSK